MGLTKPRAAQIFNLDYKQSTRVVATTNITLSGGAPSLVDGVSLSLGDRVLVTGQTTASENGLYYVTTLGSGADGTWARTSDGNETGEIEAGMIVMVTEGTVYADTQWKLITDDPITINTTALTFTQNYMANSISGGSSNVTVYSNANVTVSSAGTANVLTVSNTGTFVSGVVSATGNVTGNYIFGNGSQLTGISAGGGTSISNGTSNVVVLNNANVTVGVDGISNVAEFATTGAYVTGVISATGNITAGNLILSGAITDSGQLDITTTAGNGNIVLTPHGTGNVNTGANVSVAGSVIAGGNLSLVGNIVDTGPLSIITGSNGNINLAPNGTGNVNLTGNVMPTANATANIGSATLSFNTIFARATSAQYADLAEMYCADSTYTPGTVLEVGGAEEVTITTQSHSTQVAGIVSTNPSYLMNSTLDCTNALAVALVGRVPCHVVGTIAKGDRLVASSTPGVATRLDMTKYEPGCIIGKALEAYNSETIGTIEVAVGRL